MPSARDRAGGRQMVIDIDGVIRCKLAMKLTMFGWEGEKILILKGARLPKITFSECASNIKRLKLHLNYPPWLGKIWNFTSLKWLKLHSNCHHCWRKFVILLPQMSKIEFKLSTMSQMTKIAFKLSSLLEKISNFISSNV